MAAPAHPISAPCARRAWLRPEPLAAALLWGGVYPGAKIALAEIPALPATYVRVVLATAVLLMAGSRGGRRIPLRACVSPLVRAGLAQFAFQIPLIAALARTTAGTAAILYAASPLMTAAWLAASGREPAPAVRWLGLALGMLGVGLVVQSGGAGFGARHLVGNLLALGSAAAFAMYSVAIEPLVAELGALRTNGWTMGIAALLLTPFALRPTAGLAWGSISAGAWAGLAYGATAGMVVAMTLWGRAVRALGPGRTMVYAYLEPVSAVLIAAALIGERLHWLQVAGALCTFAGVWLAGRPRHAREEATALSRTCARDRSLGPSGTSRTSGTLGGDGRGED